MTGCTGTIQPPWHMHLLFEIKSMRRHSREDDASGLLVLLSKAAPQAATAAIAHQGCVVPGVWHVRVIKSGSRNRDLWRSTMSASSTAKAKEKRLGKTAIAEMYRTDRWNPRTWVCIGDLRAVQWSTCSSPLCPSYSRRQKQFFLEATVGHPCHPPVRYRRKFTHHFG